MLKGMQEPETAEEAADQYLGIAKELGISVSREDVCSFLQAREKVQQEKTAKAEEHVKEALDENDLENVAGGAYGPCQSTFEEGEWCWFNDSCSVIITDYSYYYDDGDSDLFEEDEQEFDVDQILRLEHIKKPDLD